MIDFYKTPIRGITPYDQLFREQDQLPKNLHIIPEPIRFDPATDTFFDGKDAYPKHPLISTGLRAKKKYPNIKEKFDWPDI